MRPANALFSTACEMPAGCRQQEELLSCLRAETQGAVTDIRRIVYGLRPPALDELGLAGALREEVARLDQQAPGLSITLGPAGPGPEPGGARRRRGLAGGLADRRRHRVDA